MVDNTSVCVCVFRILRSYVEVKTALKEQSRNDAFKKRTTRLQEKIPVTNMYTAHLLLPIILQLIQVDLIVIDCLLHRWLA